MRTRKNINCLGKNELFNLREAFAALYLLPESDPNSFARIAGLHGQPAPSYCKHGQAGFLTWHRAYLLELENALRTIHCNVTLPYWNWSSGNTTGLPIVFRDPTYQDRNGNTVPNPLYSGPKAPSTGGGTTSRRFDIDITTFGDLATTAQNTMSANNWSSFISQLDNVHGAIHGRISGDMGGVAYAAYDPIFHFHHCNVDRLGAIWQAQYPGQFPSSEASIDLIPFTKPYTNIWHKGNDFKTIQDLGYQYQNYCFILPHWPIKIFSHNKHPFPFDVSDLLGFDGPIRLRLTHDMMPKESVELRVFINDPKANLDTSTVDNPQFAGTLGVFGMGGMKKEKPSAVDISLDISAALKSCLKKRDEKTTLTLIPVFSKQLKISKAEMKKERAFELFIEVE